MKQRKKFCIVTTIPMSLNFFKGQLIFLNDYFDITAISSNRFELENFGKEEGVNVFFIPMKRSISLIKDIVSLFKFISFFYKYRPEIVHGNTPKASFLSMIAARIVGIPTRIYMCHGLRYQGYSGNMSILLKMMERITCICATNVICVSKGVKATLIKDRVCDVGKLKVIHYGSANGINLDHYNKENVNSSISLNIPDRDFIFSFVGRIVKDKGVNEMVYAFNKLSMIYSDIHLIVIGAEEPEQNPVSEITIKKIRENNRIYMVGQQIDVRPYMLKSDVFLLPSYREGFGVVLMEAGALGLPCITTDISGCNEIIQDGVNGKIIPPRDENALYEAMKWFYEHRNDEVKKMADNARPMIIDRYEQHKVWEALLKEYQSLE